MNRGDCVKMPMSEMGVGACEVKAHGGLSNVLEEVEDSSFAIAEMLHHLEESLFGETVQEPSPHMEDGNSIASRLDRLNVRTSRAESMLRRILERL